MRPLRAWLPMHSQFGLQLRLALPKRIADMLARRIVAPHVEQLQKAAEVAPIALAGEHRRPAMFVIFRVDVAAMVARAERVDPRSCAEASKRAGEQHICGAEAVIDPAAAIVGIAHLGSPL